MGRRKRKAVTYRPQRNSPTSFACPHCGASTMKVEKIDRDEENGFAIIKCATCLLEERFHAGPLTEPVDVYGDLIDAFYGDSAGEVVDQTPVKQLSVKDLMPARDADDDDSN